MKPQIKHGFVDHCMLWGMEHLYVCDKYLSWVFSFVLAWVCWYATWVCYDYTAPS